MSKEREIDCRYTDEIVCPYCGYKFRDSWEMGANGEPECPECGKMFSFTTDVTVLYISERDCALNQIEHEWSLDRTLRHRNMEKCANCDQKRFVEKEKGGNGT